MAFRSGGDLADLENQTVVAFASGEIALELSDELAPADLDPAVVELNLQEAMSAWNAPGCAALALNLKGHTAKAAEPGDGHNTIQWIDDWAARSFPKDSPGITDVQYEKDSAGHWTIVEADTYLNLDYSWTTGVPTGDERSLQAVLTHELGHVIGLLHPCEIDGAGGAPKCSKVPGATSTEMYPIYSANQTVLADDDVAGVCFLYPPGACNASSCAAGEACVDGACQPLCGDAPCAAGEVCKRGKCVATYADCGANGCVGQACTADRDCGEREYCSSSVCTRGAQPLGDVCASAHECYDGACVDGACAQSCFTNRDCTTGSCDAQTGACTAALASMGESCKFATDCQGNYCLAKEGQAPVCTRSCGDGEPSCPSGRACRQVADQKVCDPAVLKDNGCSVTFPATDSSPSRYVLALISLAIIASRFRRWPSLLRKQRP